MLSCDPRLPSSSVLVTNVHIVPTAISLATSELNNLGRFGTVPSLTPLQRAAIYRVWSTGQTTAMGAHQLPSPKRPHSNLAAVLASAGSLANAVLISALLRGTKLPDMFIEAEESERPTRDTCETDGLLDIPVIDLSSLQTGDKKKRQQVVADMAQACEQFGFLQVANHGVDQELIESCEAQAHRLFELPLEAKERAHRAPGEKFGYGANTWVDQTVKHWAESFHFQLHPQSNIGEYALKLFETGYEKFRYNTWMTLDTVGL